MFTRLRQGWRWITGRGRLDREIDREVAFHLDKEIEHNVKNGLTPEEASRVALRDFGRVVNTREAIHDVRGMTFWESFSQDVRFGLRSLRRSTGYTGAAVLILALGIGANTAMFSVIDGVLIKPLPFRDGGQLVLVQETSNSPQNPTPAVSVNELYDYRDRLHTITDLVEYHGMNFVLLNQGDPDRVDTGVVSHNFFDVLGMHPIYGRTFRAEDDAPGADAVLVLSHPYWMQKYGGDKNVVGRVVEMNNRPHTIIGVLPDFPQYPQDQDVYMPVSACPFRSDESKIHETHRLFGGLQVFGRLAPGATLEQASAELSTVAPSFAVSFAESYKGFKGFNAHAASLKEALVRDARPMLLALSGTTLLVLLITCANVANLSIARTMRRSRELAVRSALGAGRMRLLRQLITESVLVALAGGVLGLGFASITVDLLAKFVGRFTPRTGQIAIDGTVLLFTLLTSVITGVVFGAAPAFSARRNLSGSMRDGASQSGDSTSKHRLRATLVAAQVAVSFVLLVGAALLLQSFHKLATVPLGYQLDHVMTADAGVFSDFKTQTTPADFERVYGAVLDELRAAPGVTAAGITSSIPLERSQPIPLPVSVAGATSDQAFKANQAIASDGYFESLGVRLVEGRLFRMADNSEAPRVAVINQAMARFWGQRAVIGSTFSFEVTRPKPAHIEFTVIGIVGDVHQYGVTESIGPQYFMSFRQLPPSFGFLGRFIVRTAGSPDDLAMTIKNAVHKVDSRMAVEDLRTLESVWDAQLASPRLTAGLLLIFAGLALVITLAGLAGVIGTSVNQRTREFGLRMALGASRGNVLGMVLRQGVLLVAIGLVAGVGGAYLFSSLLKQYLFATTTTDLTSYVLVSLTFFVAAMLATAGPARRATKAQPTAALRAE